MRIINFIVIIGNSQENVSLHCELLSKKIHNIFKPHKYHHHRNHQGNQTVTFRLTSLSNYKITFRICLNIC